MNYRSFCSHRMSVHRLVIYCPTPSTRFPPILLNQSTLWTYLPIYRHHQGMRINEHTFTTVVNFHSSLTARAFCLSWIILKVRLSAEGAIHSLIPISQIGQSSPIVFKVSLAILKLAIPLTAFFRCEKYSLGSSITISIPSASLRSA